MGNTSSDTKESESKAATTTTTTTTTTASQTPQPALFTASQRASFRNPATPRPASTTTTSQTPQPALFTASQRASFRNPATPRPASQMVKHPVNNYIIPVATPATRELKNVVSHPGGDFKRLMVCPQYNGRGCVSMPCRRLHVCFHWATKTCNRTRCKNDHFLHSQHNQTLLKACVGYRDFRHIKISHILMEQEPRASLVQEEPEICLYNIMKRCTTKACPKVHSAKNYRWEVKDRDGWVQLTYTQSDYLELMYSHPSEECVDLISHQTHFPNNRNLQRLASLLSKGTSWTVDLEAMKLKGDSSVYNIRRLSTTSDLTSNVPVATRWLWYWQDDYDSWVPYGEGTIDGSFCVSLSDYLESSLRVQNMGFLRFSVGPHRYLINNRTMKQKNVITDRERKVRRRPACSLASRQSIRFEETFLPLPATKKFLKLPLMPLSSEFIFVEGLLKQSLPGVQVATIHRVQNDHLWKVYQTKKRLLISLYKDDATSIDEQYLFHGTSHSVIDLICEENLDWKLSGTNVGHLYGRGTYFSNLASMAHHYARGDGTGKQVMLVVLVLVGKMTKGHELMTLPPLNAAAGRTYDTTCDNDTNAQVFVKYNRDEYYPAYVIRYSCDAL